MKKSKFLFLTVVLLSLSSCGDALEICNDDNNAFPNELKFPKIKVDEQKTIDHLVTNFTTRYNELPDSEQNGLNVLQYAAENSLEKTADLSKKVSYIKIFDGEISCASSTANSRLHLYSTGVLVDLNRLLVQGDRIGVFITSSSKWLKIEATITLYTLSDRMTTPYTYAKHNFTFKTNLKPNAAEPYYYSFKASDYLKENESLIDTRLIGFTYKRLELTDEETQSGHYTPYIEDEKNSESFVKLYDIMMPSSNWKKN